MVMARAYVDLCECESRFVVAAVVKRLEWRMLGWPDAGDRRGVLFRCQFVSRRGVFALEARGFVA